MDNAEIAEQMLQYDDNIIKVDAAAFGAKFQSKKEVYRFLTHDLGAYLSSYETMTIYHMADLSSNEVTRIRQLDVKVITIPHFEGLNIERMLEYAQGRPDVMKCLPKVQREREKLPRPYLGNVIYTIVGEPFKQWVERKVNERHELRRQHDSQIHMDKEVAIAFNRSSAVAVNKGISHNLMKHGALRRRTKEEIRIAKLEEQRRVQDIEMKAQRFQAMEDELNELRQGKQDADQLSQVVEGLRSKGLVKQRGDNSYNVVENWEQHQQLLREMQEEEVHSQRLQQQNEHLQQHLPHQERRRAGNQLDAIQDYNNARAQQQPVNLSLGNSGLSQSMVIVGDAENLNQQMDNDGQIMSQAGVDEQSSLINNSQQEEENF